MILMKSRNIDLETVNARFEKAQPELILKWAIQEFEPRIALTSSFQTESIVLLHMVSQLNPAIEVLFLNTGWHFEETLKFKNEVITSLGLTNVMDLEALPGKREKSISSSDGKPYFKDPDHCCYINKVEPLELALKEVDAWISGLRRSQSKTRKDIQIVEEYQKGLFKINPLANVTSGDIWWYMKEHKLPVHPLFEKGYLSIGCWPCTKPVQPGDDERSGRWAGTEKTECGIHTFLRPKKISEGILEQKESKEEGGGI